MMAFRMSAAQAEVFFGACQELNAVTLEARLQVLEAMAKLGQLQSIVQTKMTKEEYVKHLAKHFGTVAVIKKGE